MSGAKENKTRKENFMNHLYVVFYSVLIGCGLWIFPGLGYAVHSIVNDDSQHSSYNNAQSQYVSSKVASHHCQWYTAGYLGVRARELPKSEKFVINVAQEQEIAPHSKIKIFPNPTTGPFTLEVSEDIWQGGTLSIYNIIGQKMIEAPIFLGTHQYDMSDASQGVYFLTLQKNERKKSLRFVKR